MSSESEAYREGAERGYFVGCDMADHPENSGFWSAFFKWDWLFGTAYWPAPRDCPEQQPPRLGFPDMERYPASLLGRLFYPLSALGSRSK